jgi:chromosome segregation ATPase
MQVKDLEVELEATKQKGRDTLQQAILAERERITQMQWDMDELRRKYSEMESNLKIEQVSFSLFLRLSFSSLPYHEDFDYLTVYYLQNEKTRVESEKTTVSGDREELVEELETKRKEVESLQRHLGEVEAKSKTDMKVLVKEVKSLRNSQKEMKKVLSQYLEEKTELEVLVKPYSFLHLRTRTSAILNISRGFMNVNISNQLIYQIIYAS